MANLLRSGYKMLNKSCPVCNNPIFKDKKDKMFCPICNREVIMVSDEYSIEKIKNDEKRRTPQIPDNDTVLMPLKEVVIEKIKFLNDLLAKEIKIDNIKNYTKILLQLLKVLKYIDLITQVNKKS
ncbi:MAG: Sjogren's syndrome/scleroderma autoantigen 1 family protein [Candidatus Hodarchaeota archaeon]